MTADNIAAYTINELPGPTSPNYFDGPEPVPSNSFTRRRKCNLNKRMANNVDAILRGA
jgi:hypothetical protein